jgi:hypothetical protein
MKNNQKLTPSFKKALKTLNALPRQKGYGRKLTQDDLVTLETAQKEGGKDALCNEKLWGKGSVFIRVNTVVELYESLTDEGKESLTQDELIGGWFAGDGDDDDDDGEFCSTPCHDEEVPTVTEFEDSLDNCSCGGNILFLY